MLDEIKKNDLFCEYYARWIAVYKQGVFGKMKVSQKVSKKLAPQMA